ncbi:MAG: branched-chain amino acid ABC transporter permease [Coprothermobacterota bacterium]|nr:branched-chain amino acid ABC transporter permease [Coprothermobacterota bacterium]
MSFFFQQLLNALQVGSIYALVSIGYTMVYGVLTMINFAHGDVFMVSSYIAFFFSIFLLKNVSQYASFLAFPITVFATIILTSFLAVIIERLAYKPLRNAPRVSAVITALSVGILLETLTLALIGPEPRQIPPLIPKVVYNFQGASFSFFQILILGISFLCMVILDFIVYRTKVGMAMRAISFDKTVVPLMGVPIDRIITATFALGAAVAAVGGVIFGSVYSLDPYMGIRIGWWAFIAAVLGGIGNIRGAMLGGLFLGGIEVFVTAYAASSYRDFIAFAILLLFLIFKPTGILGKPQIKKV